MFENELICSKMDFIGQNANIKNAIKQGLILHKNSDYVN